MNATERALQFIHDGQTIGLGTGRAATNFVEALGQACQQGLRIQGVPTSESTAELARRLKIPLLDLKQAGTLDITVDGADEVDPDLNLIKGYGGALVREKVVAASSRELLILIGPEKLVSQLGARGKLPVEVVPFALALCEAKLTALGLIPTLRIQNGVPFVTDNHNYILDCTLQPPIHPHELEASILHIAGVVGTGLFLDMADAVVIDHGGTGEVRKRTSLFRLPA